ncbi:hypothetical protein BKA67DRAFT_664670 [Truncatella angustata]|uniref:Uncharacterized protein n=1 Tax=Truncatella angustata TaxID=152316 RepID=A0A9P8RGZ9_9PEZI|nr:uncharacterized protein BKA67DRAFT_664670 [Truncatella angustata]KAH6645629.1 hypothetical protein BKA67DRAFT_664670 [Truncatella angustata]
MKYDLSPSITHHPHLINLPRDSPGIPLTRFERRQAAAVGQRTDDKLHGPEATSSIIRQPSILTSDVELHAETGPDYYFLSRIRFDIYRNLKATNVVSRSWISHIPFWAPFVDASNLYHLYEKQNKTIEAMLTSAASHRSDGLREALPDTLRLKITVYGSLGANVVLSILQIFAAVWSGSLSLITTMADAVFDPLSNVLLLPCTRATHYVDPTRLRLAERV